jgi:hypothetical protein
MLNRFRLNQQQTAHSGAQSAVQAKIDDQWGKPEISELKPENVITLDDKEFGEF